MGDKTTILRVTLASLSLGWLAGCSKEPPPPSVEAFIEDPILLDATMVRCVASRNSINYDPECVNAREAVERIAAVEQQARRAALEAESERKRDALRRAREAADQARRDAEERERLRQEAELLGLVLVPETPESAASATDALPEDASVGAARVTVGEVPPAHAGAMIEADGVDAPGRAAPDPASGAAPVTTDLGEIREQLEQRREAAPPEAS